MDLIRDCFFAGARYPGSILTIGNFDGVHVGHQKILRRVADEARRRRAAPVVFTFEPHPAAILHPDRAPERILDFPRKLDLLRDAGVEAVFCPDGPLAVLCMEPEEFARRIIAGCVGASGVVEGPDFTFGRAHRGDVALLRRLGGELGFHVATVEPVSFGGAVVSSTRIRQSVREGRVADARQMLGRPFEFVGRVIHGRHHGRDLGFPTVNLAGGDFLIPGDGVYAGWATLNGEDERPAEAPVAAAISVGREATFGELPQSVVEAYLLDFRGDAYGRTVRLDFVDRLRDQQTFATPGELAAQMSRDCDAVRRILAESDTPPP